MRERLNWIDWLKVLVVAGAFVFHAAQPFVYTKWLINDTEKSLPLSVLSGFGYLFGMPLMFFLAGPQRGSPSSGGGNRGHAGPRLRRLLIPWSWASSSSARRRPGSPPCGQEATPVRSSSGHLRGHPQPHLNPAGSATWGTTCGSCLPVPLRPGHAPGAVTGCVPGERRIRSVIGRIGRGAAGLVWLALPILAVQLVLRPLFPEYRDWADFALWLGYFVIGIGAMADARVMPAILRRRRLTLWLVPVVVVAYLPVVLFDSPIDIEHAPGFTVGGLAYVAWRTALGWVMTLVQVGLAATYFTARPRFLGWASAMVLPFYVIHHPVTVVVAKPSSSPSRSGCTRIRSPYPRGGHRH